MHGPRNSSYLFHYMNAWMTQIPLFYRNGEEMRNPLSTDAKPHFRPFEIKGKQKHGGSLRNAQKEQTISEDKKM